MSDRKLLERFVHEHVRSPRALRLNRQLCAHY